MKDSIKVLMEEGLKRVCKAIYRRINKKQSVFSELPNSYEDNIGSEFVLQRTKGIERNSDGIINKIKVYTAFYKSLSESLRQKELLFIENKSVPRDEKLKYILEKGKRYLQIYHQANKNCEDGVFQLAKKQNELVQSLKALNKKSQK